MARKKTVSPSPAVVATTVHDRIRLAEKSLLSGATERVLVSDSDLEKIASLIVDSGQTKAQILKKAVRLGLAVMLMGPAVVPEPSTAVHEEAQDTEPRHTLGGVWVRPVAEDYGGFTLIRPAGRHDSGPEDAIPGGIEAARALDDLENQF